MKLNLAMHRRKDQGYFYYVGKRNSVSEDFISKYMSTSGRHEKLAK